MLNLDHILKKKKNPHSVQSNLPKQRHINDNRVSVPIVVQSVTCKGQVSSNLLSTIALTTVSFGSKDEENERDTHTVIPNDYYPDTGTY